ncbi:MAG: hypothetical protein ACLPXM_20290 [Terriglobales bacterium]
MDITISVNPQFELRLDHVSIQKRKPTAADFDGNKLEIGHTRLSIFSEMGEITTGALLFVEYAGKDSQAEVPWRLVVAPRPKFEPLVEAMGKLVLADSEEAIRMRAESGIKLRRRLVDP